MNDEYGIVDCVSESFGIIIDAGSNIGLTSIYLANRYPRSVIIAIEPDDENFRLLALNSQNYENIHCRRAALWDKDGWVRIVQTNAKSWAFRVEEADSADHQAIAAVRLSTLIREHDIARIALLKMDIEGAEWEVLGDAREWIDQVDNIAVELHESIRPGCTARFNSVIADFDVIAKGRELTLASRKSDH